MNSDEARIKVASHLSACAFAFTVGNIAGAKTSESMKPVTGSCIALAAAWTVPLHIRCVLDANRVGQEAELGCG